MRRCTVTAVPAGEPFTPTVAMNGNPAYARAGRASVGFSLDTSVNDRTGPVSNCGEHPAQIRETCQYQTPGDSCGAGVTSARSSRLQVIGSAGVEAPVPRASGVARRPSPSSAGDRESRTV
jgi:hypothetical protein